MEHSDDQNVQLSSCFTLWTIKWLESKAKKDFVLINQRRIRMRYDISLYPAYLFEAWAWRLQIHYPLSCT